jgi:hypothetical protein
MKKQVKVDPFSYGAMDVVTTLVQLAIAVASVILAAKGDTSALLGLGALAGGAKGNLLSDFLAWWKQRAEAENSGPGNGPGVGPAAMALLALAFLVSSCGTGVTKQFVIDSQQAVLATASQYFVGCQMVTVAPAFSVDWNQNLTYGGGMYAGCSNSGNLVEFRCQGELDAAGKTGLKCEPLKLWTPAPEVTQ